MKDGNETDVDCGGGTCPPCDDSKGCAADGDCSSGYCDQTATPPVCAKATCSDAVKNGAETDVDCGGDTCMKCTANKACKVGSDCESSICSGTTNTCAEPSCNDGVKNGDESDVDCGGGCKGCDTGKACAVASDCDSEVCSNANTCVDASCADLVQNGSESDVDCGGTCPHCDDGKACTMGSDCDSGVCTQNKCTPPSCIDQVKNGSETDTDCGGTCATKCGDGKLCNTNGDCSGGYCATTANPPVCKSPACNDTVKNGDETDTDCGGSCANKCATGKLCASNNDCASSLCQNGACIAPTCTDGVKNGGESDVDCGGNGICSRCPLTAHCTTGGDCGSGTCSNGICVCPAGMVTSPRLGGGAFCIDQKEVTYAQYQVFYTANPPIANQSAVCKSWNTNYTPPAGWPAPSGRESEPIRYVNWCQADAYCRFVGRRLCGSITGGAAPQASFNDPNTDAWYSACSAQGVSTYPYGSSFQSVNCVSELLNPDGGIPGPQLVGNSPNCQGGTPTLFDMSGNVAEWEDSCNATTGELDTCLVRGGSWQSNDSTALRCDSGGTPVSHPRDYFGADVGFRCCL
jgi:hypothetical protein